MAPARAVEIISSVAAALDAAHAAGLVHRDVKPANMLIDVRPDRPDHVYLSDFGLSKGAMSSSKLTGTGLFLGTADYAAPEQIEGRAVDGRTDQYALACAAFELLAGAPPFQRDQATATIWAHMSEPPPPLRARRPEIPAAVDQVFAAALAKAPESRYGCCRDFAYALRWALGLVPYGYGSGQQIRAASPAVGPAATGAPGPIAQAPVAVSPQRPAYGAQATPPGLGYRQAVPAFPQFDHRGQAKGAWRRDWTAWALILAGPVAIFGLIIAPLRNGAGGYGALLFLGGLLAIPVALIGKAVRRQRRRRALGR
jgi:serine/threonine-protein kinase